MRVVCPAPRVESLLHRKERMQDGRDLRELRDELRSAYKMRSNAKQISEQLCSHVQQKIEALCTTRINHIEAELKRRLRAETFRAARINLIEGRLNSTLDTPAPRSLSQQWP